MSWELDLSHPLVYIILHAHTNSGILLCMHVVSMSSVCQTRALYMP